MKPLVMRVKPEPGAAACQYFMHYITFMDFQVPEREMRDGDMIAVNAAGTCHCLNIPRDLRHKPFFFFADSILQLLIEVPQFPGKIKPKEYIKVS